jgi:hypothetical protein
MLLLGRSSSWEVNSLERNVWLDGCLETELKALVITLAESLLHFSGDHFNVKASMMGGSMLCHF